MWYEHLLHLLHLSESPSTVMKLAAQRKLVPPRSRYAAHMGRQARPGVRPPPGTVGKVSLTLSQQCVVAAHTWGHGPPGACVPPAMSGEGRHEVRTVSWSCDIRDV
jgi:hypothetical protein